MALTLTYGASSYTFPDSFYLTKVVRNIRGNTGYIIEGRNGVTLDADAVSTGLTLSIAGVIDGTKTGTRSATAVDTEYESLETFLVPRIEYDLTLTGLANSRSAVVRVINAQIDYEPGMLLAVSLDFIVPTGDWV